MDSPTKRGSNKYVTTLFRLMDFSIKFDTVKSGWSIVYIEGSQVIISKKKYCISFNEDGFFSKQCTP